MKITAITKYKHGELYAILKRIGWSQSELARQTGIQAVTIGDIINLVKRPTPEQADAIQKAIGTAGEYLDVLSEWPEAFEGLKRGYRREQTAEVEMERLLDHPEALQIAAPEPKYDEREERLESVISELKPAQQTVLRERFWNGKTLQETGRVLKLSRDRIRNIEMAALRSLRHPVKMRRLLNDNIPHKPLEKYMKPNPENVRRAQINVACQKVKQIYNDWRYDITKKRPQIGQAVTQLDLRASLMECVIRIGLEVKSPPVQMIAIRGFEEMLKRVGGPIDSPDEAFDKAMGQHEDLKSSAPSHESIQAAIAELRKHGITFPEPEGPTALDSSTATEGSAPSSDTPPTPDPTAEGSRGANSFPTSDN